MRISIDLNSIQYAYIRDKVKIDDTNKKDFTALNSTLSNSLGFPANIDILQKANNAVFKLAQNAISIILSLEEGFLPENESATPVKLTDKISLMGHDFAEIIGAGKDGLKLSDECLEDLVVKLVEGMNEVLGLSNKEIISGVSCNKSLTTDGDGLQTLKEIILSALNIPEAMNGGSLSLSLLRVKIMENGLLSIDHQSLKEAISSNTIEVARTIKAVAHNLCDTLPLCIDPNSGALNYTGKRIEGDGEEEETSKALKAIDEEFEKEKAVLDSRLRATDELISYSNKLLEDLIHQPPMIACEG